MWAKLDRVHSKHPDMVLLHGRASCRARERSLASSFSDR
ncbi:hypothetical protein [Roseixanthobacter psychrophilus]